MGNPTTDHASRLRYWAGHPAGQAEPMRAELLNAAGELERLERELADMTSDYLRVHKAFCDLKYPETAHSDVSGNVADICPDCHTAHPMDTPCPPNDAGSGT